MEAVEKPEMEVSREWCRLGGKSWMGGKVGGA